MKLKYFFLLVLISICSLLLSSTWHINQDNTGDFTTIQEGINASVNSDTVLVYPGTYLENINFNGKSITIGSLYLTTGDVQYINETVIDGNQSGSCVRIKSGEDNTTLLCGFTLNNGNGSTYSTSGIKYGGGILIKDSEPTINNCNIIDNIAYSGGGICGINSIISLKGVTIKNNNAYRAGGGIVMGSSTINFDNEELCNIYLNYAGLGCDIAKGESNPPLEVIVDTFSVAEPDGYFIWNYSSVGYPLNDVTLICQNAKLEPINTDLYVSTEGDNNNSGLTEDEPLATINYALSLVKSDSLHPNIIHIVNGIYSKTENNQHFPLCMRGYVSLSGESMQNTILDANHNSEFIRDDYSELNYTLNNLTFVNGGNTDTYCSTAFITAWYKQNKNIVLDNISCNNCYGYSYAMNIIYTDISISNLYFKSNYEGFLTARNSHSSNIVVQVNNVINNDIHQFNPTSMSSDAKPQYLFGGLGTRQLVVNITNMELTENIQTQSDWPETSAGICLGDSVTLNLINC
ncbi:hypothetical protein ACFLYJ_03670, partial [Candidatus Cloacimonadota bacterium]